MPLTDSAPASFIRAPAPITSRSILKTGTIRFEYGDAGKKNNIFGVDVAKAIAGVTTSLDDDHALACFLGYDGKASLNLPTATMFDAMSEDDPAKAVTCTQDGEGYVTAAKWGGVGMDMMGIGVKVTSETIFEFTYAE